MTWLSTDNKEKQLVFHQEALGLGGICSNPLKLIHLKCDYPAPEGLESSRTSNGPTQKAIRHPRGTLINYIFTGSSYDRQSTLKVGGIIQHPPDFCGSKILQSFKFTKVHK